MRRSCSARERGLAHQALDLLAGTRDQRLHLLGRLAKATQDICGHDLRVARVGAPHSDPHAREVRAAELAPDGAQPVVACETSACPRAHLAEREVDLVVNDEHARELHLQRSARRPTRAPGIVHERLRAEDRDARARGRALAAGLELAAAALELLAGLEFHAPLGDAAAEALLPWVQAPALGERERHFEAHVVPRAVVLGSWVAEADDQPVDRSPVRAKRVTQERLPLLAGGGLALSLTLGCGFTLLLADQLGLLL